MVEPCAVHGDPSPAERLSAFHARNLEYLRCGYDRAVAARFVVAAADRLRGPALDIGTGKGLFAIELARRGLEVVSLDVDNQDRELASALAAEAGVADRIAFERGDAARLRYPDACFGCVVMMDVLHHLADPGPVLSGMARVVRPDGLIVIADFDEAGFELVAQVHRQNGQIHPRTAATVADARTVLSHAGFRVVSATNGCLHDIIVLTNNDNAIGLI